jgi:cation diffusion facilitator family transporter
MSAWMHHHRYETGHERQAERRTTAVVALTATMMVAEIVAGSMTNSMALLADGFHMSTHVAALGIAAFAYGYARRHADDRRYCFGTGKVGALAAFTSAIILVMVALLMVWESGRRLTSVQLISFDQALAVAGLGLTVNIASAVILAGGGQHDHAADDHHHHHHGHQDHNLRAAYLHVIADAFTSILAIGALLCGKFLGWWWLDPLTGIVGAAVIANWSWGLLGRSGGVLLDMSNDAALEAEVRAAIEGAADNRLADLHLWQVGPGHWAAVLSIVTHAPQPVEHYRELLGGIHELSHVTVEVLRCDEAA